MTFWVEVYRECFDAYVTRWIVDQVTAAINTGSSRASISPPASNLGF